MSIKYSIRIGEKISVIINDETYFIENENGIIKIKKCGASSKCEDYHIPAIPPKLPSVKGNLVPEPPSIAPPPPRMPPQNPPKKPYITN